MKLAVWLGTEPPSRSNRWLDGTLAAAAAFEGVTVDGTALPFGSAAGRGQAPTVDGTALPFGSAAGRGQAPTVDGTALPFGSAAGRGQAPTVDGTALPFGSADGRGQAPTVIAAGEQSWLDLANAHAKRAQLDCIGVPTTLRLDYLGWAQIVAAVVRTIGATTVFVDEASHPDRWAEVAAIAELLDAAQLTHVVSIVPDGAAIRACRVAGKQLQTVRLRGPAVIGLRIASAAAHVEESVAAPSAKRLELAAIGLDPLVLGHRAVPPRSAVPPKQTLERIVDHLAVHLVPRPEAR